MHTVIELIGIGFCQPKFYKPHVWRKAKAIMEWLCDNTRHVQRYDFGRGLGKYCLKGKYDVGGDFEHTPLKDVIQKLAGIYNSR